MNKQLLKGQLMLELWKRGTAQTLLSIDPLYKPVAFHYELAALCDRLAQATLKRETLNVLAATPPRLGKTTNFGLGLPLHVLALHHEAKMPVQCLYITASSSLAGAVSNKIRKHIEYLYKLTGDNYFKPSKEWSAEVFETKGGFRWHSKGWTSSTAGIGANLLIIDDAFGTSLNYRSAKIRNLLPTVIEEDVFSRRMGGVSIIQEARRGEGDLIGYQRKRYPDQWETFFRQMQNPQTGEYLWPERFGEKWRADNPHLTDSSAIWRSLYQQEPVSDDAYLIEAIEEYDNVSEILKIAKKITISVDLATSAKKTADPTAVLVFAWVGESAFIVDYLEEQLNFTDVIKRLSALATEYSKYGPLEVLIEAAAGGVQLVDLLKPHVRGIRAISVHHDKVSRLMPCLPQIAAKQLLIPKEFRFNHLKEVLLGYTGSPADSDHLVDALTLALNENRKASRVVSAKDVLKYL